MRLCSQEPFLWEIKMKRLTAAIFACITSLSVHASVYDFSKVDCNSIESRKLLISEYTEVLKENGANVTVIDSYDQETVKASKNELICLGTYEFSDSDVVKVKYRLYLSSLGEPISFFEPVE